MIVGGLGQNGSKWVANLENIIWVSIYKKRQFQRENTIKRLTLHFINNKKTNLGGKCNTGVSEMEKY